jgi:hypothetical protein
MYAVRSSHARWLVAASVIALALAGCDATDPAASEPQYVVESYQVAGENMRQVRLSRTNAIDEVYDVTRLAVRDARIEVHLLAADGSIETTTPFRERTTDPGVYVPATAILPLIQPERTYRLEISFGDRPDRITAETTVPGLFYIERANADTVVYQGLQQFSLDVTKSAFPGRQSVFVFSTEALDPGLENLTPLYRDFIDPDPEATPEEIEDELDDFYITTSPPVNEGNYDVNANGTLTIRLPWFAVAFYGPQRVSPSAVDDNVFDFLRSQGIQQGGSTLSPGEIPNVLDHVDGGTGLFGSFARVSAEVFIKRSE